MFFFNHFSPLVLQKFKWVKSYPAHPAFVTSTVGGIQDFLSDWASSTRVFFLFSAHGLPQGFIDQGDLYEYECRLSYQAVMKSFPKAKALLCYQSRFGPEQWLKPYTMDVCEDIQVCMWA